MPQPLSLQATQTEQLAIVVGAGPAGLMAATVLARAGVRVAVYDHMTRAGRKFLLAGRGGLNLTREEPPTAFARHYHEQTPFFSDLLQRFSPADLRKFFAELEVTTFVGSSGRVFPEKATATEILDRWLSHLQGLGAHFHFSHRLRDIGPDGYFIFDAQGQRQTIRAATAVLALGGASWPQTGSDGHWRSFFERHDIICTPFAPANCGIEIAWSAHFRERFNGTPLKNSLFTGPDGTTASGDAVICTYGLEGGGIYPLARSLRQPLATKGSAILLVDLKRDMEERQIAQKIMVPRSDRSWSEHLRKTLRLSGPLYSLLRECCPAEVFTDPLRLAGAVKNLKLTVTGLRPLAEAISSAGGVSFAEVDGWLMLSKLPGVFVAGEMLDWEAPTGGYLLQGAFSTGWLAGQGALHRLRHE
jgi:hypothetical protein